MDRNRPELRHRRAAAALAANGRWGFFHIPTTTQLIWPRFAGGSCLVIISIFYIPAALDIDRYRIFAWLAVFPSRTFGAVFFFLAVFLFGQPTGFLVGVLLDGSIGIASLFCLIRIFAPGAGDRRREAPMRKRFWLAAFRSADCARGGGYGGVSLVAAPRVAAGDE